MAATSAPPVPSASLDERFMGKPDQPRSLFDNLANPVHGLAAGALGGAALGAVVGGIAGGPAGAALGFIAGGASGSAGGLSLTSVLYTARELVRDARKGSFMDNTMGTPAKAMFTGASVAVLPMAVVVGTTLAASAAPLTLGALGAGVFVAGAFSIAAGAPSGLAGWGAAKTVKACADGLKRLAGMDGPERGTALDASLSGRVPVHFQGPECPIEGAARSAVQSLEATAQTSGSRLPTRGAQLSTPARRSEPATQASEAPTLVSGDRAKGPTRPPTRHTATPPGSAPSF